jgi:hypothetical protein
VAPTIGLYADDGSGALLALRTAARAAGVSAQCRATRQFDGLERFAAVIVQDAEPIRDAYVAAGVPVVIYLSNDPDAAIAAALELIHAGEADAVADHVAVDEPDGVGPAQGVDGDDDAGRVDPGADGRDPREDRAPVARRRKTRTR